MVAPISAPMLQMVAIPDRSDRPFNTPYVLTAHYERRRSFITSAGDGVDARPVVLHNGSGAALHGEDAGHLQDDVFW